VKPEPKQQPKPKPKLAKNEIGTKKKEDKPKPKPKKQEPQPVAQTAKKTVEEPAPAKPTPPPKEDDTRAAKARGGFGGDADSGLSLELGNPDEPLTILEDLEFQSYFENLMRQTQQRWSIGGLQGGIAIIRVEIGRDGSILGAETVQSAGKTFLDSAAKRAVLGMELPPLPQGYRGQKLIVNLRFNYRKDR
jgi:TonB family protein